MVDEKEYQGYWWLPGEKDESIFGTLFIDPYKDAYLELQGGFDEESPWNKIEKFPVVLGITEGNKNITIEKSVMVHKKSSTLGYTKVRLFVQNIYIGDHFEKPENLSFHGVTVGYSNLGDWVNFNSFRTERDDSDEIAIRYKYPSPLEISVGDWDIKITATPSTQTSRFGVEISEKARISIISNEREKGIEEYRGVIQKLQYFLSLGMGGPTTLLEVSGRTKESMLTLGNNREVPKRIKIFYPALGWMNKAKEINWFEMLFTLPEVEERIADLLSSWFEKAELLGPVVDLYFSVLYNPNLYTESSFLNLIHAIETYHRRKFGGKYQSDKEYFEGLYEDFKQAIPSRIEQSFKDSLVQGKLKYANEYSLRKRLNELFREIIDKGYSIGFVASGDIVNKTVDTRNYLTHYTKELEDKAQKGSDLFFLSLRLRGLLELLLLEELGFEKNTIEAMISNNRRFQYRLGVE